MRWLLLVTGVLVLDGCSGASTTAATPEIPAGIPVSVVVQRAATTLRLETGAAGFSYEKSRLSLPLFNGTNTGLVALFRRLGAGVLRVGGNSVDRTTWDASGAGLVSSKVAPADLDRLAAFLRAANWRVIYGMNFATNTPAQLAEEALSAARALGDRLSGFEIGNEPDLYHSNGIRTSSFSYANFLAEWRAYAAAIKAAVPGAVFTGPATASNTNGYSVPFAGDEGKNISLLTHHYYRANGQLATSTIDLLLAPDPNLPTTLQALRAASGTIPQRYRLAEANSFYNGGAPNVSNGYGTALWAIDFLFINVLNGSSGVNFHGGGSGPGYTPIADDGTRVVEARPEYYGMALVALAAPGALLATTTSANGVALSSYAVAADDGSTVVVLVNRDRTRTAGVSADVGTAATTATLTFLTGPGLDSTSGTQLNGATIGADGSWSPMAAQTRTVRGSVFTLSLPPATAVLARVR